MKIKTLLTTASISTWLSVSAFAQASIPTEKTELLSSGLEIADRVFTAEDPAGALESLDPLERKLFDSVTVPYDSTVEIETMAGAENEKTYESILENPSRYETMAARKFSGCWSKRAKKGNKAFAGNTLYTYWQTTEVCVKNGKVNKVRVTDAGGETSTPGWRIKHEPVKSTKNASWEGRGMAKYYFVLGVAGWDIQNPSDCLQQRLNANGKSHRTMTDCSLDAP